MLGVITSARGRVLCKDGDLISTKMIMPCFLLSPRAGSYDVTTRSRDKWITSDYAHRTEINSVATVAARRREERERNDEGRGTGKAGRWKAGKKYVSYLSRPSASLAATRLEMRKGVVGRCR